jgi:hypothetical protein
MPKSTKTTQSTTTRTRTRKTPAPLLPALPVTTKPTTATPNHDEIANRAYELFLTSGAAHGRDLEHWLQAESELRLRSVSTGH